MIIGVSGYARAGKDSLAEILVKDMEFERVAFADVLRQVLYTLNPFIAPWTDLKSVVDEHGWEYAKTQGPVSQYQEVRRLLQTLGTDVGRGMFGPNFWVNSLFQSLDLTKKQYVISDVRFPNEADAVKDVGGRVVRVERPGTDPVNSHPSEVALDGYPFDAIFNNDDTLEHLRIMVTRWTGALL